MIGQHPSVVGQFGRDRAAHRVVGRRTTGAGQRRIDAINLTVEHAVVVGVDRERGHLHRTRAAAGTHRGQRVAGGAGVGFGGRACQHAARSRGGAGVVVVGATSTHREAAAHEFDVAVQQRMGGRVAVGFGVVEA